MSKPQVCAVFRTRVLRQSHFEDTEQLRHSRPPMSHTMKIRKLKLFYFQKNARYRAKELCKDIFLGNLSLKVGKISVGFLVLILEFW